MILPQTNYQKLKIADGLSSKNISSIPINFLKIQWDKNRPKKIKNLLLGILQNGIFFKNKFCTSGSA